MQRSKRLEPIRLMAERDERQAAETLGKTRQQLEEQDQRLGQLREYKLEYQHRLVESGRQGMTAPQIISFQNFLNQLELAIEQQRAIVDKLSQTLQQQQALWQQKYLRLKAMETVVNQHLTQEAAVAAKAEQKLIDELVNNKAAVRLQNQNANPEGST